MIRIRSTRKQPLRWIAMVAVAGIFCVIASTGGCSTNDAHEGGLPEVDRKGPAFDAKALEKLTPKQRKMIEKANIQRDT